MTRKAKDDLNFLDLTPIRDAEWIEDEESGNIWIQVKKFKRPFWERFYTRLGAKDHIDVKMDEYGSWVWRAIDGEKTVREIGNALAKEYKEKVEPVHPRVCQLMEILEGKKWVKFKELETLEADV